MEFMENVEEARYFVEEERRNGEIENLLAPGVIQEINDFQNLVHCVPQVKNYQC